MNTFLNAILIIVLFAPSVSAATVWGHLLSQTGANRAGNITIKATSIPSISGTNYIPGDSVTVTLVNGGFTNTLISGDYLIVTGGNASPRISVPNTTNVYNFIDLINTNGMIYVFKEPGSVVKLDATDTTFGFLGDKLTFGSLLTVVTNSSGANESVTVNVASSKTITATGTTGTQTINKLTGAVNFAASATSLVVTNSFATTNSVIQATVGAHDSTMKDVQAVAGTGLFTLWPNAVPTAETRVYFRIDN